MKSFFARHSAYKKHHSDKSSKAYISWMLWGGDAGRRWAESVVKREEAKREKAKKSLEAFLDEYERLEK